ncbi:hypothetical protein Enr17x_22550 [Gimesia fumaroli]|uniref:Uncharacterized protein n=1 Tax=Gimesia fumaroli TaxID=2527976 RepID=A0A518IAT3_9PLAN|nr:hypothetical protein Enr17x_22550 [Gimesia fumaroli]
MFSVQQIALKIPLPYVSRIVQRKVLDGVPVPGRRN